MAGPTTSSLSTTETPPPAGHRAPADATTVSLHRLSVRIGERVLLDDVSVQFPPGAVSLIIGSSGVGKSVLLRILSGEIGRDDAQIAVTGTVTFDDEDVLVRGARPRVGIVYQSFALFDELSPRENVAFAAAHAAGTPDGHADSRRLLDELQVPVHTRTSRLSGGQKQRLAIARTLAYQPDVLLYDEPTSGLDAATADRVAELIDTTHSTHPETAIVVTHDYSSLPAIADHIFVLDPEERTLREVPREQWGRLREELKPAPVSEPGGDPSRSISLRAAGRRAARVLGRALDRTARAAEALVTLPWHLIPKWPSPRWGFRFLLHYLRLVAGPSAWAYIAISGLIIGFVATYFTFRFLPYANYTEPLLIENLLASIGFALYRILVPVLATILIAARCGAAVASDIGGKTYGRQTDAIRTFGVRPTHYLLTGILLAFLVGTPVLSAIGYGVAHVTSLVVFTATHPHFGPDFWHLYYHRDLIAPGRDLFVGSGWLLAKLLVCALGIALTAYHCGASEKDSSRDVSSGITRAILWSTLLVLVVHFAFTFLEFD